MIRSIGIENFQSHASSFLEFSPTVTAIVGTSNSGKTALIRAFEWLRTNRPLGFSFGKKGTDITSVHVAFDMQDGQEISASRVRSRTENKYVLDDKIEFPTTHGEVPTDLVSLLNINDISIQQQFDGPFLAFSSPGRFADAIMEVVKLSRAGEVVSMLNNKARTFGKEAERQKEQEIALNNKLNEPRLICVEEAGKVLEEAKDIQKTKEELQLDIRSLVDIVAQLRSIEEAASRYASTDELRDILNEMTDIIKQYTEVSSLASLIADIESFLIQAENAEYKLRAQEDIGELQILEEERKRIESSFRSLSDLLFSTIDATKEVEISEKIILQKQEALVQASFSLILCPMCGQNLSGNSKDKVVGFYSK